MAMEPDVWSLEARKAPGRLDLTSPGLKDKDRKSILAWEALVRLGAPVFLFSPFLTKAMPFACVSYKRSTSSLLKTQAIQESTEKRILLTKHFCLVACLQGIFPYISQCNSTITQ